tara:strand:+ start:212 stop:394 length:183 start_codon:yes stop_codon:yes gene_type:complete
MNREEVEAALAVLGIPSESVAFVATSMARDWCEVIIFDDDANELGTATRDHPNDQWVVTN